MRKKSVEPEKTVQDLMNERDRLKAQSKELSKAINAAKRKEAAEQKRQERAQTQAEALSFIEYCKVTKINDKPDAKTIYEWVKEKQKKQDEKNKS